MDSLTTIIEARQKASNSFAAGDYETILAEPVMLRTGDELMLKTASIDTTNVVAGTVLLEEAVTINVEALLYVTNHWYNDKTYFSGIIADTGKPSDIKAQPDFRRYFNCTEKATNAAFLTSIKFKDLRAPFHFQLKYTNVDDKQVTQTYFQPSTHHDSTVAINVYYKPSVTANPTSWLAISGIPTVDDGKPAGTFSEYVHGAVKPVAKIYEPIRHPLAFTVPAGTYAPDELCKYVNDAMTLAPSCFGENGFDGNAVPEAPFFKRSKSTTVMVLDTLRQDTADGLVGDGFTFVNAKLNPGTASKPAFESWIGASQIQLQFLNDKFSFKYMHTPFYDPDGNVSVTFNYDVDRTVAPWAVPSTCSTGQAAAASPPTPTTRTRSAQTVCRPTASPRCRRRSPPRPRQQPRQRPCTASRPLPAISLAIDMASARTPSCGTASRQRPRRIASAPVICLPVSRRYAATSRRAVRGSTNVDPIPGCRPSLVKFTASLAVVDITCAVAPGTL